MATEREWELVLSFDKPLSMNDSSPMTRGARIARSKVVKKWRAEAKDLAEQHEIPRLERFTAVLNWRPARNNRRDPENYFAAVKPLVDGLVDAGVAKDDTTPYYVPTVPVVHPAIRGAGSRMWLVVRDLSDDIGTQSVIPIQGDPHT